MVLAALLVGAMIPTTMLAARVKPASAYGRVGAITLSKKTGDLKTFTLVKPHVSYVYHVNVNTQFIPRSSPADVEGFGQGEYAYVVARNGIASSVEFDTTPFKPGPVEHVTGLVTKVSSRGFFVVQDAKAVNHRIWRNAKTTYYLDSQPQTKPLPVRAGQQLDVFAQKIKARWLAVSIDEQTS
jgi:hypothetical protein